MNSYDKYFSDAQLRAMIKLYDLGFGPQAISRAIGVTPHLIDGWLDARGNRRCKAEAYEFAKLTRKRYGKMSFRLSKQELLSIVEGPSP
jgi:hypothetical protein